MADTPPPTKRPKDDQDPDTFMQAQKERLQKAREEIIARRDAVDQELADLDGKLSRIDAYFNPRPMAPTTMKRVRTTTTRAPRQGGIREKVLEEIKKHPTGIKRADLLTAMNATDKKAEQSISNAVANLKKAGAISGDAGLYSVAS